MSDPAVHVLHDNPEWIVPFAEAFEAAGVPLVEWPLDGGMLDLDAEPPQGVFWSRLSASSHTRGAPHAKDVARGTLAWLESWDRRVVGGSRVADLEVSKVQQHAALRRAGFDVPRTLAVHDRALLPEAAQSLPAPFITKHDQGGKGLGVRRFDDHDAFEAYVAGEDFEEPADGTTLLQELLVAPEPVITRAEFVGGRFVYAVRVDTSSGFELCPADACALPGETAGPSFRLDPTITASTPLIRHYEELIADLGIEIAGIEFLTTTDGRTVTYDLNTNSNYNPAVEQEVATPAVRQVARWFGELLDAERGSVPVDAVRDAA
ncbi:alpha-L-glutamate ligase [Brachybacterium endophyticum]|uniref:Alpha-L-glutamate ligase n=1 Tax=Brachybacterium endophyticum TaxID=2182385 RepID=A0A2U2RNZ3_9MICO|nr:alpha-L-glutamate ligase [Brachybacterium endophyticum]PWH07576.1 alpha-L-glutamate ligase [Brachybacterium endophyticum]